MSVFSISSPDIGNISTTPMCPRRRVHFTTAATHCVYSTPPATAAATSAAATPTAALLRILTRPSRRSRCHLLLEHPPDRLQPVAIRHRSFTLSAPSNHFLAQWTPTQSAMAMSWCWTPVLVHAKLRGAGPVYGNLKEEGTDRAGHGSSNFKVQHHHLHSFLSTMQESATTDRAPQRPVAPSRVSRARESAGSAVPDIRPV